MQVNNSAKERNTRRQPFSPNSVNKGPRIRGATEVTSVCL